MAIVGAYQQVVLIGSSASSGKNTKKKVGLGGLDGGVNSFLRKFGSGAAEWRLVVNQSMQITGRPEREKKKASSKTREEDVPGALKKRSRSEGTGVPANRSKGPVWSNSTKKRRTEGLWLGEKEKKFGLQEARPTYREKKGSRGIAEQMSKS